ncbi:hypothetical protein DUI87_27704 [Hirundo rustica rustica]|uniref:Uncharacterized protein n=1 Tax=Hirundo rustica rustica TaxID=333673 RepID=A0A3M0J3V6_HIRRU|nr:hypothetical protein DUI87_27704 [Hirundo rustica rustica]
MSAGSTVPEKGHENHAKNDIEMPLPGNSERNTKTTEEADKQLRNRMITSDPYLIRLPQTLSYLQHTWAQRLRSLSTQEELTIKVIVYPGRTIQDTQTRT